MPRVKTPNAPALTEADEAISQLAAERVKGNPRGAPITLPEPPCVMDESPIHSTLTLLSYGGPAYPFVMTPGGELPVPMDDISRALPELAEVFHQTDGMFRARQLNSGMDIPDLICLTARECIQNFKRHFHNARD